MSNTFIYSHSEKKVVQKATMEKPVFPGWTTQEAQDEYNEKVAQWNNHVCSLQSYPAEGFTPEQDGKEFVLDRDFRLIWQFKLRNSDHWSHCTEEQYNGRFANDDNRERRIIAIYVELIYKDTLAPMDRSHISEEAKKRAAWTMSLKDVGQLESIIAYLPCDENDPMRVGGFTSTDGQSLCCVRELELHPTLPTDKPRLFTMEQMLQAMGFAWSMGASGLTQAQAEANCENYINNHFKIINDA